VPPPGLCNGIDIDVVVEPHPSTCWKRRFAVDPALPIEKRIDVVLAWASELPHGDPFIKGKGQTATLKDSRGLQYGIGIKHSDKAFGGAANVDAM